MGDPGNTGFNILAGVIGFALAAIGFLVLRDPVKAALFSGYTRSEVTRYRRLTQERSQRIGLRLFGAMISLFGLVILTAMLSKVSSRLGVVSDGLFVLMSVVFYCAFFGALGFTVVNGMFKLLRRRHVKSPGNESHPVMGPGEQASVEAPAITPAMHNERRIFTAAFVFLVLVTIISALYYGIRLR